MYNTNVTVPTLTGINTIWPDNCVLNTYIPYVSYPYYVYKDPEKCSEKIHVFLCKHCRKCECGKLELPRK